MRKKNVFFLALIGVGVTLAAAAAAHRFRRWQDRQMLEATVGRLPSPPETKLLAQVLEAGWLANGIAVEASGTEDVIVTMQLPNGLPMQFRLLGEGVFELSSINGQEPPAELRIPNLSYADFCKFYQQ